MLRARLLLGALMAAVSLTPSIAAPDAALPVLAPYQMIRSLQVLQERIAGGDHASLPMQKKMIELIDARLREATESEFADRRNIEALMIYGMSGGNPRTVEAVTGRLSLEGRSKVLTDGLVAYLRSEHGKADTTLASLDPMKENAELGGFLALIKGTVRALENPAEGLAILDKARLLSPGSLVEETALRRSITLAATAGDAGRFLTASEQYVRRFLKSPYASHFADGFINGVVSLQDRLDMAEIEEIIAAMNGEQQNAIYLRIARKAAILGHGQLADFASAKAEAVGNARQGEADQRAELYNALGAVTSESIDDVAGRLEKIDRATLSPRDVRLLDAATAVVKRVLSPPMKLSDLPVEEPPEEAGLPPDDAPEEPTVLPVDGDLAASGQELPDPRAIEATAARAAEQENQAAVASESALVNETRRKLQEIDRLLEGARQ
ncbi:chemotaxis protein MotC [Mesorhizobium sp. 1B3]|uniref:chemotaxis protein MotC n=1 Tax=Mesorhizobium sp. 1B3 TaxID=3243599 RepID=UPI003D953DCF